MIKLAHEQGRDLDAESANISSNQLIKELMSNLEFFFQHGLMENAREKINRLKEFVKNARDLIERCKDFSTLSEEGQIVQKFMEDIFL